MNKFIDGNETDVVKKQQELSSGLRKIAFDDLFDDLGDLEDEGVLLDEHESPRERKQKSGKKDNYNYESLTKANAPVLMKILACVSMLRQLKDNASYVYEASLFIMIAYKQLLGLNVNLEETAETLGINQKQLERFMDNMSKPGFLKQEADLQVKRKGRQAPPPVAMMKFSKTTGTNEDGQRIVFHTCELTKEAKAYVVDLCYFSIFEADWPKEND